MALDGFNVVCLEPGADNPKKHAPVPAPEPPEGFIDSTVYRYNLDEDGNKVLIGTMEAFPEGWDHPQQFREKGFKKQKEEVKEMPKKDIDFEAIVASQEVAEQDMLYKVAGSSPGNRPIAPLSITVLKYGADSGTRTGGAEQGGTGETESATQKLTDNRKSRLRTY